MKLLSKIVAAVGLVGAGATMYAAPGAPGDAYGAMLGNAENIKGDMDSDYNRVLELQMISRRQKDIIKLTCVNDKLVALKPNMNIADQVLLQLRSARDSHEAKTAFGALASARDAVHSLREGAEGCVGEGFLTTESSNTYTHPDIPDSPDSNPFGGWQLEPPAYASPIN